MPASSIFLLRIPRLRRRIARRVPDHRANSQCAFSDARSHCLDLRSRSARVHSANRRPRQATGAGQVQQKLPDLLFPWVATSGRSSSTGSPSFVVGYGPNDPLFPSTLSGVDVGSNFAPVGLSRQCWTTASPIRAAFKAAFKQRDFLISIRIHSGDARTSGDGVCRAAEEFKAWSQNLGHEEVLTTFRSYGNIPAHRHAP